MRAAVEGGRPVFVAVLLADGILSAMERFGAAAGDRLLLDFGRYWSRRLRAGDRLFRWSGTGFLALLDRPDEDPAGIEAEIRGSAEEYLIGWVPWRDTQAPVVLHTQFAVYALDGLSLNAEVSRAIDYFIGTSVNN